MKSPQATCGDLRRAATPGEGGPLIELGQEDDSWPKNGFWPDNGYWTFEPDD